MKASELIEKLQLLSSDAEVEICVCNFPGEFDIDPVWYEIVDVAPWLDDNTFALIEAGRITQS